MRAAPLSLRIFLPVALAFIALYVFGARGWYRSDPQGTPEYGVNFSCKRAEFFGQDCAALFVQVLDELNVRHVRLSAYWSDIEEQPGVYDFRRIDQLLELARERDVGVTVTIGMKAQRFPEWWFPTWLRLAANIQPGAMPEESPLVEDAVFPYLEAAARHIGAHPSVEAIQVENEPFVNFKAYANNWRLSEEFLVREIEAVRAADPGQHPIVVSHASWLRSDDSWQWFLQHADVVAQSVYTKRQRGPWEWLYIFPYRIGRFTPNLPGQARAAARQGKQLWIGELQAEPFEDPNVDVRRIPTARAASFSPHWLEENVRLANRSGATRVYLWGVEWWAYLRDARQDPTLWEAGRALLGGGAAVRERP